MSNKRSKKQEEKIAQDLDGGRTVVASGAFDMQKNDVKSTFFQVEAKYTEQKSFSLNKKYMKSVVDEAFKVNRLPVMVVDFCDGEVYAIIRFEELLDYESFLKEELEPEYYSKE